MGVDLTVVGLGYVGLPLAYEAAHAGLTVRGYDVSQATVHGLNRGVSHIGDLVDDDIAAMRRHGFTATTESAALADSHTVVVCVPTPLAKSGGPDLTAVRAAASDIAAHLQRGQTIILESTTYPGTTEDIVAPILETSGLKSGEDFFLAFSPERIDPGNKQFGVKNTPKVVGGISERSTVAAVDFYSQFIDTVIQTSGTREAEMAKLLENTYRHVNIALMNEMSRFCHDLGIDLWDVIKAASSKPFGFQPFYPGPGVGGHCIPIDPNYLSYSVKERLGYPFRMVELAQEINTMMPAYVVTRISEILNQDGLALKGTDVLLLGVTYKPDISDQRETPAVPIAKRLVDMGAGVSYHDPFVEHWSISGGEVPRADDLDAAVADADIVVLLQKHASYDIAALSGQSKRFFDTRGVTHSGEVHTL